MSTAASDKATPGRAAEPVGAPASARGDAAIEVRRVVEAPPQPRVQRSRRSLVLVAAAAALVAAALYIYVPRLFGVATDDAYVDAHVVSVVPKVSAYVVALHVDDNTNVRAGELLVDLDPRDFEVAVASAVADLASAEASAANIEAQTTEQQALIAQSEATLEGDRAVVAFAQQQLARYTNLANSGVGSVERLQQAQSDIGERKAVLERDRAAVEAARTHLAVLETARRQADANIERQRAALDQARLNLSYTQISAPVNGTIANKTVQVGNFVQPGQILFSMVPDQLYVTANFKETQLTNVRPGQSAVVRVDAFPGLRLSGRVDSMQRGTGAQFALLPPENATGNFVKVVQRVPVKIILDDPGEALRYISPGMSVEATIHFAKPPRWLAFLE
jgi:membrane fusion protein (multidrug efflux system)